jgi:hypothetical protein
MKINTRRSLQKIRLPLGQDYMIVGYDLETSEAIFLGAYETLEKATEYLNHVIINIGYPFTKIIRKQEWFTLPQMIKPDLEIYQLHEDILKIRNKNTKEENEGNILKQELQTKVLEQKGEQIGDDQKEGIQKEEQKEQTDIVLEEHKEQPDIILEEQKEQPDIVLEGHKEQLDIVLEEHKEQPNIILEEQKEQPGIIFEEQKGQPDIILEEQIDILEEKVQKEQTKIFEQNKVQEKQPEVLEQEEIHKEIKQEEQKEELSEKEELKQQEEEKVTSRSENEMDKSKKITIYELEEIVIDTIEGIGEQGKSDQKKRRGRKKQNKE